MTTDRSSHLVQAECPGGMTDPIYHGLATGICPTCREFVALILTGQTSRHPAPVERVVTSFTRSIDIANWHDFDRPACGQTFFSLDAVGYRCVSCGWRARVESAGCCMTCGSKDRMFRRNLWSRGEFAGVCGDAWHPAGASSPGHIGSSECSIDGCTITFGHFHRDTLDGEEVVRTSPDSGRAEPGS